MSCNNGDKKKSTYTGRTQVSCAVCTASRVVRNQSLKRSLEKSWHRSYRCNKCVNVGRSQSPQQKEKVSIALKGKPLTDERRQNISSALCAKQYRRVPKNKCPYKEYIMRSSYEVRVAAILDKLGVVWEYERRKLLVLLDGQIKSYVPDFYLPKEDLYLEVKGYWRDDARKKFLSARQLYGPRMIVAELSDIKEMEDVV